MENHLLRTANRRLGNLFRRVLRQNRAINHLFEYYFLGLVSLFRTRSLKQLPKSPGTRAIGYALLRIDPRFQRPKKFLIDLSRAQFRLDVTGLMQGGTRIASDTRSFHRGRLVVSPGWDSSFEKAIISPNQISSPSDYRYVTHETVRLMFVEGVAWQETPEYSLFFEQLIRGEQPYGIDSLEKLHARGRKLQHLWDSISEKGLQPCEVFGRPWWDEVHFYIGGNGQVGLGRHANHRIAIARTLGIMEAPALLGGIHPDFASSSLLDGEISFESCSRYLLSNHYVKSIESA